MKKSAAKLFSNVFTITGMINKVLQIKFKMSSMISKMCATAKEVH